MIITDEFIDYLLKKSECITENIKAKAELCKSDYYAVTRAGAAKNYKNWSNIIENVDSGRAEIIGYEKRTDAKTAALINGFNAHSLELDDGQRFGMIHLGASVISAIKAICETYHTTDENFIHGIIMGYEAACRVAIAMQPSHKKRGFHAAGTCGTIGAAVGVAFALNANKIQLKRTVTLAAGSAAGMLEMQEQKSEEKPYNVGRAAMDGVAAACMGLFTDFNVPDDILGGERGFLKLYADQVDAKVLTEKKDYFEIERIYVKPYASCRHSHSAVEAAIKLHEYVDPGKIKDVLVETYDMGVRGHDHTSISGIASAKLSTPYAVAAGLLYGKADLTVFEPLDSDVVELARKIKVIEKAEFTIVCPQKRIAVVTVYLEDGSKLVEKVDYAKGDPENPLTNDEFHIKTMGLDNYISRIKRVDN